MAHRVGHRRPLTLQQMLHGYSEGHRLLASSVDLASRDAKTMLMMSDASGPAATIGEEGYLTGYPLADSRQYAFARTWPAPEMPRPGCVWTHSILVGFGDIPALESAVGLLAYFRRPQGNDRTYRDDLTYNFNGTSRSPLGEDAARRILFAVYSNPSTPVISSALSQRERDELVLAMWDQQWPRLKRAFRFCTLSFADRSSTAGVFDLQFLPGTGRALPRAQFRDAVEADRQGSASADWLDDAVSDLREGSGGSLRRFLRAAGSDVSGREAFVPLATIHALSKRFSTEPNLVERAISLLDQTLAETQGQAARALVARAAASAAESLSPHGLQFVLRNFGLMEPKETAAVAESVGKALWRVDPEAVVGLLQDSVRRPIAERAIATLPTTALLQGASSATGHLQALIGERPDLATEPDYWSFPESWNADALLRIAERLELVPGTIDAMILSERPLFSMACAAFGNEAILRRLVAAMEGDIEIASDSAQAWLSEACSDLEALARVLGDGAIQRASTLDIVARAVSPDQVPNDLGEDPWLVAVHRVSWSDVTPYLATFLLTRAFGPRTRNSAELIELAFDTVYFAVELSSLPNDAWWLLDHRLHRSYVWPNWDRCLRIRQTTVAAFVERGLDGATFARITRRDDIFVLLVKVAAMSFSGQRYLQSVKDHLAHDHDQHGRLGIVERALW